MRNHLRKLFSARSVSRGMTLIEIMVVVFILGLIASVVAVNVIRAQGDAQIKKAGLDINGFKSGLNLYSVKKGHYPTTSEGLNALYSEQVLEGEMKKDPW